MGVSAERVVCKIKGFTEFLLSFDALMLMSWVKGRKNCAKTFSGFSMLHKCHRHAFGLNYLHISQREH